MLDRGDKLGVSVGGYLDKNHRGVVRFTVIICFLLLFNIIVVRLVPGRGLLVCLNTQDVMGKYSMKRLDKLRSSANSAGSIRGRIRPPVVLTPSITVPTPTATPVNTPTETPTPTGNNIVSLQDNNTFLESLSGQAELVQL